MSSTTTQSVQEYWRLQKRRQRGFQLRPKGRPRKQQAVSVTVVYTEVATGQEALQQSA